MSDTQYADGRRRYERENMASTLLFVESIFVALFVVFHYDSWKVGLLAFIGVAFLSWLRPIAIIMSIIYSLFWALIGVVIGMGFINSILFAAIFAIIAFLFSIVLHLEYYRII